LDEVKKRTGHSIVERVQKDVYASEIDGWRGRIERGLILQNCPPPLLKRAIREILHNAGEKHVFVCEGLPEKAIVNTT